jgi:hypothetical protein
MTQVIAGIPDPQTTLIPFLGLRCYLCDLATDFPKTSHIDFLATPPALEFFPHQASRTNNRLRHDDERRISIGSTSTANIPRRGLLRALSRYALNRAGPNFHSVSGMLKSKSEY